MAKATTKSVGAIQRLLAERREIERWLERLRSAADKTPEAVREKVRSDYQARLNDVIGELKGFGDELADTLRRQRSSRDVVSKQEREAADRLAEAELRHTVGEYDDARWNELHTEIMGALVKIREELKVADDEIDRMEEVMALIEGRGPGAAPAAPQPQPRAATPPPPPPPPPPVERRPPAELAEPMRNPRRSGEVPRPRTEEESRPATKQTNAFDELAFLKSVTEDETHGPAVSRASGSIRIPDAPGESTRQGASGPVRGVGAEGVRQADGGQAKRLSGNNDKTLKCADCGAMNQPTEWYCERCGAELSAL